MIHLRQDGVPNLAGGKVEHDFPEYSTSHSSQMSGVHFSLWEIHDGGATLRR